MTAVVASIPAPFDFRAPVARQTSRPGQSPGVVPYTVGDGHDAGAQPSGAGEWNPRAGRSTTQQHDGHHEHEETA